MEYSEGIKEYERDLPVALGEHPAAVSVKWQKAKNSL